MHVRPRAPFLFTVIVFLASSAAHSQKLEKVRVYQSSVSLGDPHIVSDSVNRLSIIYSVYEALVKQDSEGNYQPSLAESWVVGEDGRTWMFNLRGGVKFHNGDVLRASDVVATLRRVLDPAIGGAFGTQGVYISYLGTAEISAIDDSKVQIITERPMADLLDLLVAMPISPESELHKLPHEYLGSGPYKIAERSETKIILEAHDEYWGTTPPHREIHWIAEPDPGKRVDALLNGQADIASDIGVEGKQRILQHEGAAVHELDTGLCIIFMLNAQKGACRDRRVRQALNYALDKDKIIDEVKKGAATPLNGYLTPHHFGYNPETPIYPYDPERARKLLTEAGYRDGLKLVFDIPSVMPDEAPELTKMMAKQLDDIGVSIEVVEHQDRPAYAEMVREKKINDGCCFDSSPRSTYRVLREKIQSTLRGPWWQGYENKQVNSLIEQAQATFNTTERQKIYQRIYTIIRDDAPWIFLYRPTRYWGVHSTLKDWKPRTDGLLIFVSAKENQGV
jgi:peptide/nickel transport system substrate-binding protein